MILIRKITDEDFNIKPIKMNKPRKRLGARGLVFNENGDIAILYKKLKNEYKLIGGGIEENELPEVAFEREVLEETGYKIKIDCLLGEIIEEKSQDNFKQKSYVYISHVVEKVDTPKYTEKEIGEGSMCIWVSIEKAMKLIKDSEDKIVSSKYDGEKSIYHTKFIIRRDYEILKYYMSIQKNNLNKS